MVKFQIWNADGLSLDKYTEIEENVFTEGKGVNIVCITETHHRTKKLDIKENVRGFCALRDKGDKKGGGIQILMPKMQQLKFKKVENKNKELLEIEGNLFGVEMKIIIVYFDANRDDEGKKRNKKLKKDIENKIERNEKEGLIIAGDFNGHLRMIDGRNDDKNGKMITEWVEGYGMILLNLDEKCEGRYTRVRGEQRTTVDYILVNKKIYDMFENMRIDENKEVMENSDHVIMSMELKTESRKSGFQKPKWIVKEYLSDKEGDVEALADEIEKKWERGYPMYTQEVMEEIRVMAHKKLNKKKRRKEGTEKGQRVIENIWMTDEIRRAIIKRKKLNRDKRNDTTNEGKEALEKRWLNQKRIVQKLIRDAKSRYEIELTNEIKRDKRGNKMWEHIDKLTGRKENSEILYICSVP